MRSSKVPGFFIEMLRSFTSLAGTLNLSRTVKELNSTRQTVRRHINLLEEQSNRKLFNLVDRQYQLTEDGKRSLRSAELLLLNAESWLAEDFRSSEGLDSIGYNDGGDGPFFYNQQHRLPHLEKLGTPTLIKGFKCWANSLGSIESKAFSPIRPYLVIYRRHEESWICSEIGDKSAFAKWWGWGWAKSSIGTAAKAMPHLDYLDHFIMPSYEQMFENGGVRYDHFFRNLPRPEGGALCAGGFQRLLMGCVFPDGQPALAVLIEITEDLSIEQISPEEREVLKERFPIVSIPLDELT